MTPKHQQLVDDLLWRVHLRTEELITGISFRTQPRTREQMTEPLRNSLLGRHLTAIALYAEGYPYSFEQDVRASAAYVGPIPAQISPDGARPVIQCGAAALLSGRTT